MREIMSLFDVYFFSDGRGDGKGDAGADLEGCVELFPSLVWGFQCDVRKGIGDGAYHSTT